MGNFFLQECLQKFTGPVGPVEVIFYWPVAVFGNFYWPRAIGSPLIASSPDLGSKYIAICTWSTAGTRTAEKRGQEFGHLAKMYYFRLHFALFLTSITSTYIKLSLY